MKPIILIGAGGHARVLLHALKLQNAHIIGCLDPQKTLHGSSIDEVPILGGDEVLDKFSPDQVNLVNALGSVRNTGNRKQLFEKFKKANYDFFSVIHPKAIIPDGFIISEGLQVMAAAVIQPGSKIGVNTIINTGAIIDHDCTIGAHVHLATGVRLSGGVTVDDGAHIGTGACIIQSIRIGCQSLVGAGSVVIGDVPAEATFVGNPAKKIN